MPEKGNNMQEFSDKKEVLISAAQDIFGKYGYSKTSLEEIARSIGLSKSTLYHYVENKEDLFKSVIEKESQIFLQEIIKSLTPEMSPEQKLKKFFVIRMRSIKKLSNIYSVLMEEYQKNFELFEKLRKQHDEKEKGIINNILKEGNEQKQFKIKETELTSSILLLALKGIEHQWTSMISLSKIEENIDALLDILFHGLKNSRGKNEEQ